MLAAHWAEDDLLTGDSMEHIEEGRPARRASSFFSLGCFPSSPMSSNLQFGGCPSHTESKQAAELPSPASLPHEWLPYCCMLYGYCWNSESLAWRKGANNSKEISTLYLTEEAACQAETERFPNRFAVLDLLAAKRALSQY